MSNYISDDSLLEARKLMWDGELVACKKKLEDILETEPKYGRAHYLLGWIYWRWFSEYKQSQYHLNLAIKFSPEFPYSYVVLAALLNETNNSEALQRHAIKALQVPGVDKAEIHNTLGQSFEKTGNLKKSMHHYQVALMLTVCDELTKSIESSIERLEKKLKKFSLMSLFKNEVVC